MMDALPKNVLQNLVEITSQRDHLHLEMSILSALAKLPSITQVRTLEFHVLGDEKIWVRPRVWMQDGQIVTNEVDVFSDPLLLPLGELPRLKECIDTRMDRIHDDSVPGVHVLWLPVWMHEKIKVCIEVTQSEPFTPHGMDVLLPVFQVYHNYQSLLDYSERDALTGLLNRKTFDEHLLRFAASATAGPDGMGRQPWLAVMDIDHFKQVNDRFGHLFGDEVLILVSQILQTAFGTQDRIFRFGGEEFVVLLHPMTVADAEAALNNFRQMVQGHTFPQVGKVTISIGFAGASRSAPVELLGRADQALYYAKANGRNRVCNFEALQAEGELGAKVTHSGDIDLF